MDIANDGPRRGRFSPISFIGVIPESEAEAHRYWQGGVDEIYRFLKSGSLLLWPQDALKTHADLIEFVEALARKDPFNDIAAELPGKWIVPWLGPLLHPSPFGKGLLEKHGIDNLNAPLCIAFIEEVEGVFEAAVLHGQMNHSYRLREKKPSSGMAKMKMSLRWADQLQENVQIMVFWPDEQTPHGGLW